MLEAKKRERERVCTLVKMVEIKLIKLLGMSETCHWVVFGWCVLRTVNHAHKTKECCLVSISIQLLITAGEAVVEV